MIKQEIQEIIGQIRKAEGDYVNTVLPERLRQNGFRTFFIDDRLLVLKSETDAYTLLINIRHEVDSETDVFRMWINKPMYYADITMDPESRDEARTYAVCVLEILSNKTFYHTLRQRLEAFDRRMLQFRKDLETAPDSQTGDKNGDS